MSVLTDKELAEQLRCPSGNQVSEFGNKMYQSNFNMIDKTINLLNSKENSTILELGFGNGSHITKLFEKYRIDNYYGLEISEAMINEASKLNMKLIEERKLKLNRIENDTMNLKSNTFDYCFSINTIYFWNDLSNYFEQFYNVLKNEGELFLTFIQKESAEKQSFTQYNFNLYTETEIIELLQKANFKHIEPFHFEENAVSKNSAEMQRKFTIIKAKK